MSNWESINFSKFLPPEIPNAILQVTSLIDQFLALYQQSISIAKGYQMLLSGGRHGDVQLVSPATVQMANAEIEIVSKSRMVNIAGIDGKL